MDVYLVAPEEFFQLEGDMGEGWGIFTDLNLAVEKCKEWSCRYEWSGVRYGEHIKNVVISDDSILVHIDRDELEDPDSFPAILRFDYFKKSLNEIGEDKKYLDLLYTQYANAVKSKNALKTQIKAIKPWYSDPEYSRKKRASKQLLRLELKNTVEIIKTAKYAFKQKCGSIAKYVKTKKYVEYINQIRKDLNAKL